MENSHSPLKEKHAYPTLPTLLLKNNMLFIFIFFFIAFIVFLAQKPHDAKEKSGITLDQPSKSKTIQSRISVATYNIQTGKTLQGNNNLNEVANIIKDNDIVGIQEIYAPKWLNLIGIGQPQCQTIAATARFGYLFCATRMRWFKQHRGNAVLTQLKCESWQIKNLVGGKNKKTMRNMTIMKYRCKQGSFTFINTHITTKNIKHEQIEQVLNEFNKHKHVILTGDFNLHINDDLIQNYLATSQTVDAIASLSGQDNSDRIDWILVKGFTPTSLNKVKKGVSDHPYYQVMLEYQS